MPRQGTSAHAGDKFSRGAKSSTCSGQGSAQQQQLGRGQAISLCTAELRFSALAAPPPPTPAHLPPPSTQTLQHAQAHKAALMGAAAQESKRPAKVEHGVAYGGEPLS